MVHPFVWTIPAPIDVAVHVEPVATVVAAERLRRPSRPPGILPAAGLHPRPPDDPQLEAAAHDAPAAGPRVATARVRVRVGLYVTVRGQTQGELDAAVALVQGCWFAAAGLPPDPLPRPAGMDHHPGRLGPDQLACSATMDTARGGGCFPFALRRPAPTPHRRNSDRAEPAPQGPGLLGPLDPAQHNQVILARSLGRRQYSWPS